MTGKNGQLDPFFMRRAVRLALKAWGRTSPNPLVGAVIVKDGIAIGSGFHHFSGGPHAEIEAIRSLKDPSSAKGATLYVTLEPCSTAGLTPPCCDAILKAGFRRVAIGTIDPNPKHAGRGIELLRKYGIRVDAGIEEEKCKRLNEAFFRWITTGKPFVLLKLAQTLDGRIATKNGSSQWITSEKALRRTHRLRLWADAILAGTGTFRLDHPRFTARDPEGRTLKTPRRFIVTRHPETLSTENPDAPGAWEFVNLPDTAAWHEFLARLGRENVLSLLIEGGGETARSALDAGIVDRVEFHIAPKLLGGRNSRPGIGGEDPETIADFFPLADLRIKRLGEDFLATARPLPKPERG